VLVHEPRYFGSRWARWAPNRCPLGGHWDPLAFISGVLVPHLGEYGALWWLCFPLEEVGPGPWVKTTRPDHQSVHLSMLDSVGFQFRSAYLNNISPFNNSAQVWLKIIAPAPSSVSHEFAFRRVSKQCTALTRQEWPLLGHTIRLVFPGYSGWDNPHPLLIKVPPPPLKK
jgi:hypothetical protein